MPGWAGVEAEDENVEDPCHLSELLRGKAMGYNQIMNGRRSIIIANLNSEAD
jgi:hypothetical protein